MGYAAANGADTRVRAQAVRSAHSPFKNTSEAGLPMLTAPTRHMHMLPPSVLVNNAKARHHPLGMGGVYRRAQEDDAVDITNSC